MSTFAKKDKEETDKIISMRTEYENQIESLRTTAIEAEKNFKET